MSPIRSLLLKTLLSVMSDLPYAYIVNVEENNGYATVTDHRGNLYSMQIPHGLDEYSDSVPVFLTAQEYIDLQPGHSCKILVDCAYLPDDLITFYSRQQTIESDKAIKALVWSHCKVLSCQQNNDRSYSVVVNPLKQDGILNEVFDDK